MIPNGNNSGIHHYLFAIVLSLVYLYERCAAEFGRAPQRQLRDQMAVPPRPLRAKERKDATLGLVGTFLGNARIHACQL
jgi:hypothetical protein